MFFYVQLADQFYEKGLEDIAEEQNARIEEKANAAIAEAARPLTGADSYLD